MQFMNKLILILDTLNREGNVGVVELSRKTDMPTTTVYRILTELTQHGLVERDPETKKYSLGWKLVELSAGVLEREREFYYLPVFEPLLRSLAEQFKDTVYLTILKNKTAVCIAKFEGDHNLRYYVQVGKELPFHCSASAKVLLAYLPEEEQQEIIAVHGFTQYTPSTINSKESLLEHLTQVRARGYAICDNELEIGAQALAVPVLDTVGQVFASIAIVGPRERISDLSGSILPALQRVAREVSSHIRLGGK